MHSVVELHYGCVSALGQIHNVSASWLVKWLDNCQAKRCERAGQ